MTAEFREFLDLENTDNEPSRFGPKKNAIGMNVDKPNLGYFDLVNDEVFGIICSDNANS
jgi:hypothetical protein